MWHSWTKQDTTASSTIEQDPAASVPSSQAPDPMALQTPCCCQCYHQSVGLIYAGQGTVVTSSYVANAEAYLLCMQWQWGWNEGMKWQSLVTNKTTATIQGTLFLGFLSYQWNQTEQQKLLASMEWEQWDDLCRPWWGLWYHSYSCPNTSWGSQSCLPD